MMRTGVMIAVLLLGAAPAAAQAATVSPAAEASAEAEIAGVLRDVYAVISGPKGQARDWARMRTMFTPDARLTAIGPKGPSGGTLDDYIARSGPLLIESGFTEDELARRVEIYGNLAHAWSSYEGTGNDGKLKVRGINSIQLVRRDGRWLVQSILWQPETPAFPLPADMRRSAR